jgi:EAL domain-containing protein (putative c-di-GMP-specific phosphodiesterase class I)
MRASAERHPLRSGLARDELRLSFQPIVELGTGRIVALEALVRWESPELGTVRPRELIPLAEQGGSILELGSWVLEEACAHAAAWPAPLPVHVNIAAAELADPALPERVRRTLERTGLGPGRLCLEVGAQTALAGRDALRRLRPTGVALAIDDLGPDPAAADAADRAGGRRVQDRRRADARHAPAPARPRARGGAARVLRPARDPRDRQGRRGRRDRRATRAHGL